MTVDAPAKSIANDDALASDDPATAACPFEQLTTKTKTATATETTTPSSSAKSDDELKRVQLQALNYVEVEVKEDRKDLQQSYHDLDNKQEKSLNQCIDSPRADGTAEAASLETSSVVPAPPSLARNALARPANVAVIARSVPQEYRREKGNDQSQQNPKVGGPLRGPGAYPIRPPTHGGTAAEQHDESTNNEDDHVFSSTNDEHNENESPLLSDDPESALEAQVVPERDLNNEVQQRMDALTIDALTVEVKIKDKASPPRGAAPKSVILIMLGVCLVLVAIGSAIGIMKRKERLTNKSESVYDESAPTSPPTFVSDMELARAIFSPLSGNEALWDGSSPQYKALWWIVHEDLGNMMMKIQDETQSSSSMIVERYVMALLYFSTDGPNWFEQGNFLGNTSICDWGVAAGKRVECNDEGSAVHLAMSKCVGLYILPNTCSDTQSPQRLCLIVFPRSLSMSRLEQLKWYPPIRAICTIFTRTLVPGGRLSPRHDSVVSREANSVGQDRARREFTHWNFTRIFLRPSQIKVVVHGLQ
jgi:hypothetical protein